MGAHAIAYGALSSDQFNGGGSSGASASYDLTDAITFFGGTGTGFALVTMQFSSTRQGDWLSRFAYLQFGGSSIELAGSPNPYGSLTAMIPIIFGTAVPVSVSIGASAAGGDPGYSYYGSANADVWGSIQVTGIFDSAGRPLTAWQYTASQPYSSITGGTFGAPIPEPSEFAMITVVLALMAGLRAIHWKHGRRS
jgi:hypothetical protein